MKKYPTLLLLEMQMMTTLRTFFPTQLPLGKNYEVWKYQDSEVISQRRVMDWFTLVEM